MPAILSPAASKCRSHSTFQSVLSRTPPCNLVTDVTDVTAVALAVEKEKGFESIVDILPAPLSLGNPNLLNTGVEMLTVVGWPSPNGQRTIYADRSMVLSLADGMIKSRAFIHDASRCMLALQALVTAGCDGGL